MVLAVSDESRSEEDDRSLEGRIAALAREIAETINAGQVEGREGLRDFAITLVRDAVQTVEPTPVAAPQPAAAFNPFGIGIPFVLMGAVLVFLFPLVGLLMFAAAAAMIGWGIGTTLLARNSSAPRG